jgi:hypothetical protein
MKYKQASGKGSMYRERVAWGREVCAVCRNLDMIQWKVF